MSFSKVYAICDVELYITYFFEINEIQGISCDVKVTVKENHLRQCNRYQNQDPALEIKTGSHSSAGQVSSIQLWIQVEVIQEKINVCKYVCMYVLYACMYVFIRELDQADKLATRVRKFLPSSFSEIQKLHFPQPLSQLDVGEAGYLHTHVPQKVQNSWYLVWSPYYCLSVWMRWNPGHQPQLLGKISKEGLILMPDFLIKI